MTTPPATLLIVDDQPENLGVLAGVLQPEFRVRAALSGELALRAAAQDPPPDLALLDIMMPGMDGFTLLPALRALPGLADLPVVFVTALGSEGDEERGLAAGAVDYITKPIQPAIVLARIRTHLELRAARERLREENRLLEERVAERTAALDAALRSLEGAHERLKRTHFETLMAIGDIASLRGEGLSSHAHRVAKLARRVAQAMDLEDGEVQEIFISALLHDLGRIGLPDFLLRKPVAAMTREELEQWRQHAAAGAEIIARVEALKPVAALVRSHHELFDGTGFPDGLSGLHIPLGARIIGACNDYEALKEGILSERPWSARDAGQYLVDCAGSRYDPAVIEVLEPIVSLEGRYRIEEVSVPVASVAPGQRIARDVRDDHGRVLLARGTVLDPKLVEQLQGFAKRAKPALKVSVERMPA
jgi:putative two-component system response regulator